MKKIFFTAWRTHDGREEWKNVCPASAADTKENQETAVNKALNSWALCLDKNHGDTTAAARRYLPIEYGVIQGFILTREEYYRHFYADDTIFHYTGEEYDMDDFQAIERCTGSEVTEIWLLPNDEMWADVFWNTHTIDAEEAEELYDKALKDDIDPTEAIEKRTLKKALEKLPDKINS